MLFIAARLAKAGYFGGDPQAVLEASVITVKSLLDYEAFEGEYEKEYIALNRKE